MLALKGKWPLLSSYFIEKTVRGAEYFWLEKKTPVPQILSRRYGLYRLVELKSTEISREWVNLNFYNMHFDLQIESRFLLQARWHTGG